MKARQLLPMLLCVLGLGACTVAKSPVGVVKEPLKPELWEGDWFHADKSDNKPVHFHVKDAANGVLEASGVGDDDKPGTIEIYIRKLGDWEIASMAQDQTKKPVKEGDSLASDYYFTLVNHVGDDLIMFVPPKDEVFKHLIDTKGIEGKLLLDADGKSTETYEVADLPESAVPILKEASGGNPFDAEKINTVLQRRK